MIGATFLFRNAIFDFITVPSRKYCPLCNDLPMVVFWRMD